MQLANRIRALQAAREAVVGDCRAWVAERLAALDAAAAARGVSVFDVLTAVRAKAAAGLAGCDESDRPTWARFGRMTDQLAALHARRPVDPAYAGREAEAGRRYLARWFSGRDEFESRNGVHP